MPIVRFNHAVIESHYKFFFMLVTNGIIFNDLGCSLGTGFNGCYCEFLMT